MHTLSEAAKLLGCSDPRHLTKCMQYAGIDAAKLPIAKHDKRQRLLSDGQLEQLRDAYAQLYGPKHASAPSGDLRAILERLEAIEQQLAALQKRAPYLFAPMTRSEGRQAPLRDVNDQEAMPIPESHYSALHARSGSTSTLPDGYVPADRFAQAHGMRESQRTTWLEAIRDGRLPGHVNREGWRVVNARGNVTKAVYALDAEGRRVFCALWRDTEWFHTCEECPHDRVYAAGVEDVDE